MSGAGRRPRPVASLAAGARPPAAPHRWRRPPGRHKLLYIGGSDGATAQSTVYVAQTVGNGNFDAWAEARRSPKPRADASVAYVAGSIFVIGGTNDAGAPTDTCSCSLRMPSPASWGMGDRGRR